MMAGPRGPTEENARDAALARLRVAIARDENMLLETRRAAGEVIRLLEVAAAPAGAAGAPREPTEAMIDAAAQAQWNVESDIPWGEVPEDIKHEWRESMDAPVRAALRAASPDPGAPHASWTSPTRDCIAHAMADAINAESPAEEAAAIDTVVTLVRAAREASGPEPHKKDCNTQRHLHRRDMKPWRTADGVLWEAACDCGVSRGLPTVAQLAAALDDVLETTAWEGKGASLAPALHAALLAQ